MSRVFLALGTNEGDRRKNLEVALAKIRAESVGNFLRVSSTYETPALIPPDGPSSWLRPHYNLCCEIAYDGTPHDLLRFLKQLEKDMGRNPAAPVWGPRIMDIDILLFGDLKLSDDKITLPHLRMKDRAFVLDPLSDLLPEEFLVFARKQPQHQPRIMGILNASEDSFSNKKGESSTLISKIDQWIETPIAFIDLGGVSTRPGAEPVSTNEEWKRLEEPLLRTLHKTRSLLTRPKISIDTTSVEIAARALELGVDMINDVSALANPKILDVVKKYGAEYVLMHSLSIPANPSVVFDEKGSCLPELHSFFKEKIAEIKNAGITSEKIYLDPGIGFGKSAKHSLEIMKQLSSFTEHNCFVLAGHSRKSFMKAFSVAEAPDRDAETLALSLQLAERGADVLRVHDPLTHHRAFLAAAHVR